MSITKKRFTRGIILKADDIGAEGVTGELKVGLTSQRLHIFLEGALRTVVTQSQTQTLSNKTIDADTNTIANLEVDNLKAGTLNTSTTLATASDVQIPSALAVKTYVDDKTAAQNEASEIAFAPVGNISATNVQTMGQELDADLSAEIAARIADVNAEETRAIAAETLLQSNIDALSTSSSTGLSTHEADTSTHGITSAIVGISETQTLTNKTIDADLNTVSNLEVDNLKAGVLNTSPTLALATDTQVPSALAAKSLITQAMTDFGTALDQETANRVADVNAEETRALTAEAALQTQVDTKVTKAASSTDNAVPRFDSTTGALLQDSGVIVSDTNAVSGITQLDVDGLRLDSNTLSTTNLAPLTIEPNALSYVDVNGNTILAQGKYFAAVPVDNTSAGPSITVNGKNIRLTSPSLTTIDTIVADAYGKEITLINRTGNDITINNDTGASTSERIFTGTGAAVTLKNNASFSFVYDGTTQRWNLIGGTGSGAGGSSSLDTIFQLYGDELLNSWTTGNNATFLGGGTLAGTFAYDNTTPLNGVNSYRYTQAAGSLNDYIAGPAQTVAARFRGQTCILSLPFNYNGNSNEIAVVVYDVTNSALLPTTTYLTGTSGSTKVFTSYITIPATCSSIRVGFKVAVLNSGKILNFDDVQLSQTSLYVPQPLSQSSSLIGLGFTGVIDITGALSSNTNTGLYSYNSTTGVYTILKRCSVDITATFSTSAAASVQPVIYLNTSTILASSNAPAVPSQWVTASVSKELEIGETFKVTNNTGTTSNARVYVTATATSDQILTAPETFSTDTASLTYASSAQYTLATLANAPVGTFITFTYAASTNTRTQTTGSGAGNLRPTQTDADMNSNGIRIYTRAYNAASTGELPACIAIQIGKGHKGFNLGLYKSAGKTTSGEFNYIVNSSTVEYGINIKSYNEVTGVLTVDAGLVQISTNTVHTLLFSDNTSQTSGYLTISASKNPALTGMNVLQPRIATISDIKASGTAGGSSVVGWQTRTLNTLDDGSIGITLSANQFTLPVGEYYIESSVPSFKAGRTKSRIRNITDTTDAIIGSSEFSSQGADYSSVTSTLTGRITVTTPKTFELQTYAAMATATNGLGVETSAAVSEIYSVVKITKVK